MTEQEKAAECAKLVCLVDELAAEMKKRLLAKMNELGSQKGWDSPEWAIDNIKFNIMEQALNSDPIDAANYCAFFWHKLGRPCHPNS